MRTSGSGSTVSGATYSVTWARRTSIFPRSPGCRTTTSPASNCRRQARAGHSDGIGLLGAARVLGVLEPHSSLGADRVLAASANDGLVAARWADRVAGTPLSDSWLGSNG